MHITRSRREELMFWRSSQKSSNLIFHIGFLSHWSSKTLKIFLKLLHRNHTVGWA